MRGWFPRRCVEKCHYDTAASEDTSKKKINWYISTLHRAGELNWTNKRKDCKVSACFGQNIYLSAKELWDSYINTKIPRFTLNRWPDFVKIAQCISVSLFWVDRIYMQFRVHDSGPPQILTTILIVKTEYVLYKQPQSKWSALLVCYLYFTRHLGHYWGGGVQMPIWYPKNGLAFLPL